MNISKKLAIPVVISVITATIAVLFSVKMKLAEIQENVYLTEKFSLERRFNTKLESLKELVLASSLAVANSKEATYGLANNDRNLTIEGLKVVVAHFQKYTPYANVKLHVHDRNLHSFVRHWKLDKYGDDLSGFRETINEVKRTGIPISAIEIGRAGLLLRGISPVRNKNKYIGSAEFILTMDELNKTSSNSDTENSTGSFMFSLLDKKHLNIATSLKDAPQLNETYVLATEISRSQNLFDELKNKKLTKDGTTENYYFTTIPLIDFAGNQVGITVLGKTLQSVNQIVKSSQSIIENQLIYISIIFFILVLIVFIILHLVVIKPLKTISKEIDLSRTNKDLSLRLSHRGNDEIGLISRSYNQLIMLLNLYLAQNHQSIINISEAANQMSEATAHTSNGLKNQEVESEEVKGSLDVMLNQVQEIAEFSQQAADSALNASTQAQEGKLVSENAIKQIKNLVADITNAAAVVEQLREESQEIENFTSVIKKIADQTNLLALNAAIEAARAGESGRGFAVVADEVRNLASKTQDSTTEIDSIIERLKGTIETAVSVMHSSNEQADKSLKDVNDMEDSLEAITSSITHITNVNKDIAETTKKQVPLFENLSHNMISSVAQFSMMLSRSLQDTSSAAFKMGISIKGMYENIDDFKIDENPALLLMAAKSSHFAWKTRTQSYILGIADIDPSDACDHHECHFGKWLFSSGKKSFGQYKEYDELVPVHKTIHDELFKIIDCTKINNNSGRETAVIALNQASKRLFQLMDILGSHIGLAIESPDEKAQEFEENDNVDLF